VIIKVLGSGCTNCQNLERTIEHVTDPADIASYGVMRTPALVIDGAVVISGRVPTRTQVHELLTAAAT
jgi:hypothetical protein